MGRLVGNLRLAEVPALPWEARDVDTWADLVELRERFSE
jgi:CTP:molybdopterin cytidylyltransferase MocA